MPRENCATADLLPSQDRQSLPGLSDLWLKFEIRILPEIHEPLVMRNGPAFIPFRIVQFSKPAMCAGEIILVGPYERRRNRHITLPRSNGGIRHRGRVERPTERPQIASRTIIPRSIG